MKAGGLNSRLLQVGQINCQEFLGMDSLSALSSGYVELHPPLSQMFIRWAEAWRAARLTL